MKIVKLTVVGSNQLEFLNVGELEFHEDVKSYFSVNDSNYLCSCIISTHSNFVYRIDILPSNICLKTAIDLPSFPNLVCHFVLNSNNSQMHWCYWLERGKVLKFSHNSNFEINCSSTPKMRSRELGGHRFCLTTENNEILIVNPNFPVRDLIPRNRHCVTSIDYLTIISDWILIWDVEKMSVTCMFKRNNQWNVLETRKWQDSTRLISFENVHLERVRCLPALESSSGDGRGDFVFMTLLLNE